MVGEEDGGTGTLATLLRGHTADGAVVVEPTRLRVVPAQAGSLMFRLVVRGLSAHGCVREEGVNAVEKFVPLLAALRRLEAERCGVLVAGAADAPARERPSPATRTRRSSPSTVCRGRSRSAPSAPATGRAASPTRWSRRDATASPSARMWPRLGRRSKTRSPAPPRPIPGWRATRPRSSGGAAASTRPSRPSTPRSSRRSSARRRIVTGAAPPVEGVTYGADMRLLVNVGRIPTVLFGPGDVRVAHMPDEYVPIDDLAVAARDARRRGAPLLRRARIVSPSRASRLRGHPCLRHRATSCAIPSRKRLPPCRRSWTPPRAPTSASPAGT